MTAPVTVQQIAAAYPGTRAARMAHPRTVEVLRQLAEEHGVCTNPVPLRRTLPNGQTEVKDVECGRTLEAKCKSCSAKAKKLRQVQCREGWHRTTEPVTPQPPTEVQIELVKRRADLEFVAINAEQIGDWEWAQQVRIEIAQLEEQIPLTGLRGMPKVGTNKRRVRSTKRRDDVSNLPRRKVEARTIGQVYEGRDGRKHYSSTALTLTLGSYGRVRRSDSMPVNFDTYDYVRAARDAIHFPKLLDRFWQNLRRGVGWNVQYFGCVEPQKRLAPHAHYAARGTFPRALFRQIVTGTYHQVWWPSLDVVAFPEDGPQPEWYDPGDDTTPAGYISPWIGQPLPTWEQAMDELQEQRDNGDALPLHVIRFGDQAHEDVLNDATQHPDTDHHDGGDGDGDGVGELNQRRMGMHGVEAGTDKAEKAILYLTKYITKSVDECHTRTTARQIEHHRRFHDALRFEPCSPRCANWLRYGIQPHKARPGMLAGRCKGKVHQPATLGIGGRRTLVSRDWSGKTLADHRADQRAWVRMILAAGLGYELQPQQDHGEQDQRGQPLLSLGLDQNGEQDQAEDHDQGDESAVVEQVRWERANPGDRDVRPYHERLWRSLGERIRQRAEWQAALALLNQTGPPGPADVSATTATRRGEAA